MSENELLPTITEIRRSGNAIGIYTYYAQSLNSIIAFITNAVQNINGVIFKENHLGYTKNGYSDVSFYLDGNGHLIVKADDPNKFDIDSEGHLTITE
jgi:hypothetical protein